MENGMNMTVITPEGILFEGLVERAKFPGIQGEFTVWRNHAPFLSALKSGVLSYTIEGQTHEIALRNGFVEISNNTILVCIENQEPK